MFLVFGFEGKLQLCLKLVIEKVVWIFVEYFFVLFGELCLNMIQVDVEVGFYVFVFVEQFNVGVLVRVFDFSLFDILW